MDRNQSGNLEPGNLENAVELPTSFFPVAAVRPDEARIVFIPNGGDDSGNLWSQEHDGHWREYAPVRGTAQIVAKINSFR